MDIYPPMNEWVFKLYGCFCVWQFETNYNLFNITVSIATLHTVTSLILNSATDIFLQILQSF